MWMNVSMRERNVEFSFVFISQLRKKDYLIQFNIEIVFYFEVGNTFSDNSFTETDFHKCGMSFSRNCVFTIAGGAKYK